MHSRSLKSILSLLGLTSTSTSNFASAQDTTTSSYSWGKPFSVDGPSTSALPCSSSQVQLLPSASSFNTSDSAAESVPRSVVGPSPLVSVSTSTSLSLTSTVTNTAVASSSGSTKTTTMTTTTTTTTTESTATNATAASVTGSTATGKAVSIGAATENTPYVRMGVVGLLAGVVGVYAV
ncbi:hypothetical protein K504DRAFT_504137 [Pleomassaria siparia CBS 279.74]|uniref:Uncharacterized protein n=1 Tax=Pleomassaria siparia CBS 279.74 TaxID=1314801 RepID=A0A6G1K656_9PLEO|nr:hypothetical protein K504DRAFT_504137 [Pleomassaria siparia CBS 279.74]